MAEISTTNDTLIALPWRGEFGMMLMKWVRHINGHPATSKIICTTRGSEALYPSATDFYYDWEPVQDIQKNSRLLRSRDNYKYLCKLREQFKQQYPNAHYLFPSTYLANERIWNFTPKPTVTRGLFVDVVVGPRYRRYGEGRNFLHWQEVANGLNDLGYKVGAIGAKDTSVDITGILYKSWDYDFLDSGIEMLQNCQLALMSCSGPAHLAVLCSAPLLVIYDRPNKAVDGHGRWYMGDMQQFATTYCEPILYGWNDPKLVIETAKRYLSSDANTKRNRSSSFI